MKALCAQPQARFTHSILVRFQWHFALHFLQETQYLGRDGFLLCGERSEKVYNLKILKEVCRWDPIFKL